ncbi:MAG TPA: hypothetical protein VK059_13960 [Nocardioidaceae bacterium]|nr:hypothetical protein [Nocardioidaceae bacterium]
MSSDAGNRPEEPDDVDREFERIIAGIELEAPDVAESREPRDVHDTASTEDNLPPVSGPVFDPRMSDRMSRSDYEEFAEQDDPDDHFVPPVPPRQRMRPLTWLGWLGAVGTPAFMVLVAIFGWYIPGELAALLVCGFVAGVVYLIMTMSRDPDDWDDGAVI